MYSIFFYYYNTKLKQLYNNTNFLYIYITDYITSNNLEIGALSSYVTRIDCNLSWVDIDTQLAIRWVFRCVDLRLWWALKFYIGPSEYHFPMGRGLGVRSFQPAVSDHSNDYFQGDRNWIKIKKHVLSSRCLIFESSKPIE